MQVATRHMRHSTTTSRQLLAQQLTHRVHKLISDSKYVFMMIIIYSLSAYSQVLSSLEGGLILVDQFLTSLRNPQPASFALESLRPWQHCSNCGKGPLKAIEEAQRDKQP